MGAWRSRLEHSVCTGQYQVRISLSSPFLVLKQVLHPYKDSYSLAVWSMTKNITFDGEKQKYKEQR